MKTKEAIRTDTILTFILVLLATLVSIVVVAGNMSKAEARVITEEPEAEAVETVEEEAAPVFPFEGVTNGSAVRFRERPNTSSKIFEEMKKGSALTVEGLENGWYLVSRNGLTGYVKAEFVDALNN